MIAAKCFGQEWISAKAEELRYPDKNVIERVVRAFSLLDMLARSGCPFVFKGGTSLMLLLIMKIRSFMYSGRQYRIDEAIIDAARDAYMLTLIEKGINRIEKYSFDPMSVAGLSIEGMEMNKLNKLKKNFPEAFWYWYKTYELLK